MLLHDEVTATERIIMAKRKIEIFTAGCALCEETVVLIRESVSSCGCEVVERRCTDRDHCAEALQYGIRTMPTVVVDGAIVFEGRINKKQASLLLRAAM